MLLPGNRSSFLLGFDKSRSSSVWSSDSMMIVASFKQVLSLTCATRVVLSKTTLFFDLWHGKHSVSHVPCCSFWNCLLSLLFFCFFITFFFYFYYFDFLSRFRVVPGGFRLVPARFRAVPSGFRLVPARFRAVPAGSGRFRVGSAFYIHPLSSFFWAAYTLNKFRQLFWLFVTDCQSGGSPEPFLLSSVVFPFSAYIEFPRLLTGRA